jgi:Cu/Ag efflux protein CusF
MKSLIAPVFVTLVAAGFSAHSIAATDHGGHGTLHAPAAAKVPPVEETVKKIDKPTGKVTVSQGALPNSRINASRSGPASPDGHAHEHTEIKQEIHTQ